MSEETKKLTYKQRAFIDEYLRDFNATQAAIRAGYSEHSARQTGSDLLAETYISEQIERRLSEIHMTAEEALKRTADIARSDIGELIDNNGLLDLRRAREKGLTRLIKKIKQKTVTRIGKTDDDDDVEITEIEFELYNAHEAIRDILKVHGKFTDRVDVTSKGERITERIDDERFDRAISTLVDALRDSVSGKGKQSDGEMGSTK